MLNITRSILYLALLGMVSLSSSSSLNRRQAESSDPSLDVPEDAKSLPKDCQDILFVAGVNAAFKAGKNYTDEYVVSLKLSTTADDVTNILAAPYMAGVTPKYVYTREFNRAIIAKLTYQQVCSLDRDARVTVVLVCEPDLCQAEPPPTKDTRPGPSLNSGLEGAPDVSGLTPECARVVWYTITDYSPSSFIPGMYEAWAKIWPTKAEVDAYFEKQPGTIRNAAREARGYYQGNWTYPQLCEIEKNVLVSRVETLSKPLE